MADSTPPLTPRVVFVPSLRIDRGMGHLRRCLAAAAAAGPDASVYFAAEPEFIGRFPVFERSIVQSLADAAGVRLWGPWPSNLRIATVVCDLQAAPLAAFVFLRERSDRLIGWDEGGDARFRFPYLVDSLPHNTKPDPNVRLPGLLGLSVPPKPHRFERPIRRVLVVFGGADPAGLTLRFLQLVKALRARGRWPYVLTVVRGPLSRFIVPPDTEVLEAPDNLAKILGQWDLTVTSWGLTALESLAAGTPVLLLNPTAYHERLSRAAGLPTFGVRRPRAHAFSSGLEDAPAAARRAFDTLLQAPLDAGSYFATYQGSDGRCPVCQTSGHPVFFRTETKSYHRCATCTMEYLSVHQLPKKSYTEAYFFEDYEKQYGKTYLQDFAHIQGMGRQRLQFLENHAGVRPPKKVFDVGCAYGPFLAAAAEAGYEPFGVEVSPGAVEYVRNTLGFPVTQATFPDFQWDQAFPHQSLPHIVTLWYVIEHFPHLDAVLKAVHRLLPDGGFFAFSTPNGRGLTRTFLPEKFWTESPDDHFSIWNPKNVKVVLNRYGFDLIGIRVTGHHPERFPGASGRGALYHWIALLSPVLRWGDTFEVYAQKSGSRKIQEFQ